MGIEEPREELIKRLLDGDYRKQLRILSIFGIGGLGKTTLAKSVYDKLKGDFIFSAFLPVGQNPIVKKVLMDILHQLDKDSYSNATMLDEGQLIGELRDLLQNERYLIVIDDIWDIKSWEIIRCALVDSNCGSVIITTTRILRVAEESDHVYKHEPLSHDDSRELFYKRLSIGKGKTSYDQSVEISERILQKCSGVPLAIITIASLLAGKQCGDWSDVYNNIGFGQGDNIHVDNTRKILLYSYYDLPYHLRTCLLHLSIYPEDYEIQKDILIWKWAAEGFIHEKPGMGFFELGEKYFNELINRSMIQPVEVPHEGIVYACRVHDLVVDMIYSLSKEEKFFTVLDSNKQCTTLEINNARRLAVQNRAGHEQQGYHNLVNKHMPQVRSFNATMCPLSMMPSLSRFQALRVLALEGCTFIEDRTYHLVHLGSLLQLRYLGLSNTPVAELPPEIGNLRLLQTLDLRETQIKELPQSIGQLRQMKCLRLGEGVTGVSDWIGKLTSLEELLLHDVSLELELVKELGKLTELRELEASFEESESSSSEVMAETNTEFSANKLFTDLMHSVGSLLKLQAMKIVHRSFIDRPNCEDYYEPSRHLWYLGLHNVQFPGLPAWVNPSCLPHLSHLYVEVRAMETWDLETLGRFPELTALVLGGKSVVFADVDVRSDTLFLKLRYFSSCAKLRFLQGAMPVLEYLGYSVCPEAAHLDPGFASIGNLSRLEKVEVRVIFMRRAGNALIRVKDLEDTKAAVRHAVRMHPNNPILRFHPDID